MKRKSNRIVNSREVHEDDAPVIRKVVDSVATEKHYSFQNAQERIG